MLDENGHLFIEWPRDNGVFCLGCGYRNDTPEAGQRCSEAEGLAADIEAQRYVAEYVALAAA